MLTSSRSVLRKWDKGKWGFTTEKDYREMIARKKHLDEKIALNGSTERKQRRVKRRQGLT